MEIEAPKYMIPTISSLCTCPRKTVSDLAVLVVGSNEWREKLELLVTDLTSNPRINNRTQILALGSDGALSSRQRPSHEALDI